ncbi:MAG TPA: MFS transporter [Xylanibacter oryzae]|nr:MFS transporter [Prevotella sp.]HRN16364.1 MFS transporter [Xylanibacter oryzae]
MTEKIRQKLSDSAAMRWTALVIVALTMMMGYFLTDVMSPLENMLETQLHWTSSEYGFFSGSYGYINVFLLMLFFGGIILDKMGVRFTGIMASSLMVFGAFIKFYAISNISPDESVKLAILGYTEGIKIQVLVASLGFSIFGVGCEIAGITVSKIIAKWFNGHEMALAMGFQVALARLGTAGALAISPKIASTYNLSAPILFGAVCLVIGLLSFIIYCVLDKKLDASIEKNNTSTDEEESFKFSDLGVILKNPGFWLVTFLCLLFYSGVFPFLKFATKLMIYKYGVPENIAGFIPAILPFGTIILTPLFGTLYDRIGKGATLMIIGSIMLTGVHICFALPILNVSWFAIILMILLGVAFSLVPSAMWPSVPKIIPMKQLGSAYAIIFYIQNIGLSLVPVLIGNVIEKYSKHTLSNGTLAYDFTIPMAIFATFGVAAVITAIGLHILNGKKHYGLEQANIKK